MMRPRGPGAAARRIGTTSISALRSVADVCRGASAELRQSRKSRRTAIMAAIAGASLLGTLALGGQRAAQASGSFSCGPHTWTYAVSNLSTQSFGGVRCVMYPDGGDPLSFAWYGEGDWGGHTYRHIGKAQSNGDGATATASAADLAGGDDQNVYSGTIAIRVAAWQFGTNLPTEIDVTGVWWEHWSLVPSVAYSQLPQITYCGNNVDQYLVAPPADHTAVIGLRCVLQLGPGQDTAWYGMGHWVSNNYTHIGIMHGGQTFGEAADLCDPNFGVYCNRVLNYGLTFAHVGPHTLAVSGDWDEFWQ